MGGSRNPRLAIAALVLVCSLRTADSQSIVVRAIPPNLNVFQGRNIEFYCYCTPGSTPVSSLKWLHNGMVVASRTTCSGSPLDHQLWNVDSDDEGMYTCRMELSNGTTVERNFLQALNVVDPASIQAPAQQYALLHSNTTLNCTTTFSETSDIYITWMKNDTNRVSNQIVNVDLIHEGNYMCEVYLGHLGGLVMKKNVDFYVIVPPAITSHPRPFHEITSNQPLTFTVEFQSRFRENTTVTWYLNGSALPEGRAQTQYSSELDGRTTLRFNPVTRSDRGVYRVVVRNSFGIIPLRWRENETSFQISIIVPPALPSNVNVSNTTSSQVQVQVTWSLTHQHADERAESLTLTVLFSNGTIAQQYQLEGNATQQMVDTVPGMDYLVTVSVSNEDGTRTTDPVPFQTQAGAPSPPLLEVTRVSNTTFSLSVNLAYTGGGAITHFRISFRNAGTTSWNPLGEIPATQSPDSSLVWSGIVSRDEFAGMTLEFRVVVVNGMMYGSTAAVVQEQLILPGTPTLNSLPLSTTLTSLTIEVQLSHSGTPPILAVLFNFTSPPGLTPIRLNGSFIPGCTIQQTLPGLEEDTEYTLTVSTINMAGIGPSSNEATFKTDKSNYFMIVLIAVISAIIIIMIVTIIIVVMVIYRLCKAHYRKQEYYINPLTTTADEKTLDSTHEMIARQNSTFLHQGPLTPRPPMTPHSPMTPHPPTAPRSPMTPHPPTTPRSPMTPHSPMKPCLLMAPASLTVPPTTSPSSPTDLKFRFESSSSHGSTANETDESEANCPRYSYSVSPSPQDSMHSLQTKTTSLQSTRESLIYPVPSNATDV